MIDVLDDLRRTPGVLGCLVATTDGIVVCSCLADGLDDTAAAAFVSSLLGGTAHLLGGCGRPRMERLVLKATRGQIVVEDLGHSYLVAVTDRHLDLDQGILEIRSAAKTLRRLGSITV